VKLTAEQKEYLEDRRNVNPEYYHIVGKWLNEEELPANIELLFHHILTNKAKDQHFIMMDYNSQPDLNIYDFDNRAQLYRRYPDGWYKVQDRVNHHPKFKK